MISLFDISLQLNGFPIKKAKTQLDEIRNLSEEQYTHFLQNRKEEIVAFHLKNNSFYQELAGGNTKLEWENLPILNKQNLQKPLEERLSKGYTLKNVYLNKTSGSSGTPFVFAKDKHCHSLTWTSIFMRFGWYDIDFNRSYQARFYGIPMNFTGYYKERIKDFLTHRFRFPVFDLSDGVLEKFLQKFKTKKFDYINGYTSSIVLFAKYLEQKNLILKEVCPSLKACFVTSEMLFESDKKLLEKQFGIPVINEYGASELDLIAFENLKGEWQVNSETLFVEILDENNQILPYGKEGRIVITSLFNKAHPFIRYDIGDIGILDEKSTPQKPILKKLIGRTNDIALLPSGKKAPGLTFYYVTKSIIEDDGNVKEFIIKQMQLDSFEIEYVSDIELNASQIEKIEKAITVYLEPNLTFSFTRKTVLNRSKSGKLKQFKSYL
ncbi:phenylacetate--CoA ligase family protein [Flavobacterium lipolyticum]|uniref:Phenylacetate--CoA ligase family protein n=1 Tax=Flavobacterium lipolyticum TaxID=2893754 RepID=A0ABS8M0T0_9FLAO|nr:phenylacetate--CoA ligase family protein [Flavobacterium sp. F-126]MCC9017798.1 phenylacetate--CoA ligase family protein [Flavobacterium sp. F-126]